MTTVNVQRASTIKAIGIRTNKNCRAVFCITTGEVYASVLDAAEANGIRQSAMSYLINNNGVQRNTGKKFCFISNIAEHLDEIAVNNRERQQKVMQYDAMTAKRAEMKKVSDEYEQYKKDFDSLRQKLAETTQLMNLAIDRMSQFES